jgi:hypothetical protein
VEKLHDAYSVRYCRFYGSPYSCIYNPRNSFNFIKSVLYARSSKLIPDKANLGFRFLVMVQVVVVHVKVQVGIMYS